MSLQDSGQEIEYHETENEISLANGLDHIRLPFAYKLHILLSDMESNKCKNIISWVEDGNAFKIHDRERFEQVVQPHYFRQSKLSSFIRQVSGLSQVRQETMICSHKSLMRFRNRPYIVVLHVWFLKGRKWTESGLILPP